MNPSGTTVGIDIGSSKVAVCVGHISEGLNQVIGAGQAQNTGVRRGMVVDIEDTVSAVSAALEEAERACGAPIESAWLAVGGSHIVTTQSKGIIAIARADGVISEQDVDRVIEAARAIALPQNKEILHCIPRSFLIDGQDDLKDPVGMHGIRLETETVVIGAQTSALKNLTKAANQAGLNIDGLIFSPLASIKALTTKKQREIGVMLLDIGAGTTTAAIYEENDLTHAAVFPIGSAHLTNDLAIGLKTSIETAETVKLRWGIANPDQVKEHQVIDLNKISSQDEGRVKRQVVAEIIEARLKELFGMVRDQLKSVDKDGMLPSGVVLTGGGSLLEGLVELAKKEYHLPARLAGPVHEIGGMLDRIDHPSWSVALGMMLWGQEQTEQPSKGFDLSLDRLDLANLASKAKNFLRQLLP